VEVSAVNVPTGTCPVRVNHAVGGVAVPLRTGAGGRSFLSMTAVFGTSVEFTLPAFATEPFLPTEAEAAAALRQASAG
jgi:hypothetical protein